MDLACCLPCVLYCLQTNVCIFITVVFLSFCEQEAVSRGISIKF